MPFRAFSWPTPSRAFVWSRAFRNLLWLLAALICYPLAAQPASYIARFQTLGQTFQPEVVCGGGDPQLFQWTWSDNTTSTSFPFASKTFSSSGSRFQYLTVTPPNAVTLINLGFDGSDDGWTNIYTMRPSQDVGGLYFPLPLTNLQYLALAYNPITNILDFTGFAALQNVECWHCSNLQHVVVTSLPRLRRVSFEQCDLGELNLSNNPNLEDVRGALNSYTGVTMGGGTGPKIWHWCFRDNPQITQDFAEFMTNFYSLKEPWFWNANQGGNLKFVSTNLTDVEVHLNHYSAADFTGEANMFECLVYGNLLTNLVIDGCTSLVLFDAHDNLLPGHVLDSVLTQLDEWNPALTNVDVSQNSEFPSYLGYAHYSSLTNHGVPVNLDFPPTGATWPIIQSASTTLLSESCLPTNNAIDPGENVTVLFTLKNTGTRNTGSLLVTLLSTNGVILPSAPQNYGVLVAGGSTVGRSFSFTAAGPCGSTITALLRVQDSTGDLALVAVPFRLGLPVNLFTENFDAVTAPALPAGWSTSATGAETNWVTQTAVFDTPPNAAFAPDAPNVGLSQLVSPPITLPLTPTQLSFQNRCDLEPAPDPDTGYDGGVLEIKIGTNDFTDILAAGGSFVTGGYDRTLSTAYQNPLAGRSAWSGPAATLTPTLINLPPAAAGQTIQLRWLCGTDVDNGNTAGTGWYIDSVAIIGAQCCGAGVPPPLLQPLALSGGTATVTWNALAGQRYRLQFKTNLNDTSWSALVPDIVATGATASVTDNLPGSTQRFYRVWLLP